VSVGISLCNGERERESWYVKRGMYVWKVGRERGYVCVCDACMHAYECHCMFVGRGYTHTSMTCVCVHLHACV